MRMLYATTSLNYPIHRKRLESFRHLLRDVRVLGFDQQFGYPTTSIATPPSDSGNSPVLGKIQSGNYGRRFVQLVFAATRIRAQMQSSDIVYAVGFDAALLVCACRLWMVRRPKLVYEIHDIRQTMLQSGLVGQLFRAIERWIVRNTGLLVVTAPSYLSGYYQGMLGLTDINSFVLENKLWPHEVHRSPLKPPTHSPLRIGYFGSLRCPSAWDTMTRLVETANGAVEISARGAPQGIPNFHALATASPHIQYEGPFRDPDDVFGIYSQVSIIWIAGFHGKGSYVWSRSCRFYTACCYKRPMIAQKGTDEGAAVEGLGIGCCVDLRDTQGTIDRVLRITPSELAFWYENLCRLPPDLYIHSDDHDRLLKRCAALLHR